MSTLYTSSEAIYITNPTDHASAMINLQQLTSGTTVGWVKMDIPSLTNSIKINGIICGEENLTLQSAYQSTLELNITNLALPFEDFTESYTTWFTNAGTGGFEHCLIDRYFLANCNNPADIKNGANEFVRMDIDTSSSTKVI